MVKCPYCGNAAMSLMRKSGLGPGRFVSCQSCGKPVTTHSMGVFAAVPAVLGGLFARHPAFDHRAQVHAFLGKDREVDVHEHQCDGRNGRGTVDDVDDAPRRLRQGVGVPLP